MNLSSDIGRLYLYLHSSCSRVLSCTTPFGSYRISNCLDSFDCYRGMATTTSELRPSLSGVIFASETHASLAIAMRGGAFCDELDGMKEMQPR